MRTEADLAAIYYNLTNSSLDYARGRHDALNSVAAGAFAGGLFKCTCELS